jgi:ABC-type transport system involved in cytochrome c biogenesis permease component
VDARLAGLSAAPNLALLGACLALALLFSPIATATAIRISLE